jgi:hypothetical protein
MKLHVSASNGHHQVSTPIKKNLYIYVGGVDVEISTYHSYKHNGDDTH